MIAKRYENKRDPVFVYKFIFVYFHIQSKNIGHIVFCVDLGRNPIAGNK